MWCDDHHEEVTDDRVELVQASDVRRETIPASNRIILPRTLPIFVATMQSFLLCVCNQEVVVSRCGGDLQPTPTFKILRLESKQKGDQQTQND